MRLFRSRKSQLYLLAVLIICIAVFTVVQTFSRTTKERSDFADIAENFMSEAPQMVDGSLASEHNLTEDMARFTDKFIAHAKAKNINLEILTLLVRDSSIMINNRMLSSVNVTTAAGTTVLTSMNITSISTSSVISNVLKTTAKGQAYQFTITEGAPEFKAVISATHLNQTDVRVYG